MLRPRILSPIVDGALVGAAAGLLDASCTLDRAVVGVGDGSLVVLVAIGLAIVAGVVVGTPVIVALRAIGRHPWLRRLGGSLSTPGPRRVAALVYVAGLAVAALALAGATAETVLVVGARYRAPGASAALVAGLVVAVAIVLALLVSAVLPPLAEVASRWRWAQRVTRGSAGGWFVVGAVALSAIATDILLDSIAPAWDSTPALLLVVDACGLITVAWLGVASRLGPRRAVIAAAVAAALATVALVGVGRLDRARGAIAADGVGSQRVLRGLWSLTDGDGDGFGDGFGARDCDDGDPRVHPHAPDVAGDGVDGNCAGGDPDPHTVAAARAARPSATPGAPRRDVVLVTIDSMRADHTSLAGYAHPTTPSLAALAARAARFDRAYSPAPLTRRAVPALLYGRMAGALPFSSSRRWPLLLDSPLPTLATTLAAAGYRTAAIVSHRRLPLSDATYRGFAEVIGLSDELVSRHHDNADAVVDRALAWLAAPATQPRFLWIHLIDPHYPYRPPATAPALPGASAYDRELAFADAQLGRLLAALSADRTIVAVTADHGEALGEHHRRFHGKSLDEAETRVPLVIAVPGGPPSITTAPVTLVDVAPTLLDLAGLETPAGMTGASLSATVRTGAAPPPRAVVTELFDDGAGGRELVAVHDGDRKLVRDLAAWTVTAYDLARDPHERAPLTDAATIAALTRALGLALDREQGTLPAP